MSDTYGSGYASQLKHDNSTASNYSIQPGNSVDYLPVGSPMDVRNHPSNTVPKATQHFDGDTMKAQMQQAMDISDMVPRWVDFSPSTTTAVVSVLSSLVGLNMLFFRWLNSKFDRLASRIELQNIAFSRQMDELTNKNQSQHEGNLYRFEKISVALARLGSTNGTK